MNKKPTVILVVAALIILGLVTVLIFPKKHAPQKPSQVTSKQNVQSLPLVITQIDPSQVPSGLPANLPMEANTKILQNFSGIDPVTGQVQSTRIYVSKKSLDENYNIYKKYLQDNGWKIKGQVNEPNIKNFDAGNSGGARLTVTIGTDNIGEVTVNLSYVN